MTDYEIIYERGGLINGEITTRRGKVKKGLRQIRPEDALAFALLLREIHADDLPQLGLSVELERFNAYVAIVSVQRATGCSSEDASAAVAAAMPELYGDFWMPGEAT